MEEAAGRLEWIDTAKGLGILLVIFAHSAIPANIQKGIYTFHMPLFFFLSGYVFRLTNNKSFMFFFKKRIKSLIIPYFCFSFITYAWLLTEQHTPIIKMSLVGIFTSVRATEWMNPDGPLWFVACLFLTEMFFYLITTANQDNSVKISFCLLISLIIAILYVILFKITLPWSIDAVPMALVFYGTGYLSSKKSTTFNKLYKVKYSPIFLITNLVFGTLNIHIDMFHNTYGNFLYFFLAAFSGIAAFITIIKSLPKPSMFLTYTGKNSLILLALHQSVVFPIIYKILAHLHVQTSLIQNSVVWGIVFTLLTIIILYPAIYTINNYFPYVLGKTRTFTYTTNNNQTAW